MLYTSFKWPLGRNAFELLYIWELLQLIDQIYWFYQTVTAMIILKKKKDFEPSCGGFNDVDGIPPYFPLFNSGCIPHDHLLLDSAPDIGPLISRWELDKFKNCLNKNFRTSKILTLLYQQFSNLLISQWDMSGPKLGARSNNRWSGSISQYFPSYSSSCIVNDSMEGSKRGQYISREWMKLRRFLNLLFISFYTWLSFFFEWSTVVIVQ